MWSLDGITAAVMQTIHQAKFSSETVNPGVDRSWWRTPETRLQDPLLQVPSGEGLTGLTLHLFPPGQGSVSGHLITASNNSHSTHYAKQRKPGSREHTAWFHLHGILEKTKLRGQKADERLPGARGGVKHKGTQGNLAKRWNCCNRSKFRSGKIAF